MQAEVAVEAEVAAQAFLLTPKEVVGLVPSTPAEVVGLVLPPAQEVVRLVLRLPKEAVGLVLSTEHQCCSETQGSAQQCCLLLRKLPELLSVLAAGPCPCRWGNMFLEGSVTHQDKSQGPRKVQSDRSFCSVRTIVI